MICAECGCDVRGGIRLLTCQTGGDCCCESAPALAHTDRAPQ